ncbi:large ribosomal subunit protein mL42-like [Glandiceps talaboti]
MAASIARRVSGFRNILLQRYLHSNQCCCGLSQSTSRNYNNTSSTKPQVVVSRNGEMIICYHPSEQFPYEHSQPIPRPDPAKPEQTHEEVLRLNFVSNIYKERAGPDEEELAEMFYTTKHRWFPQNQKAKWQKKNPPRDREGC